MNMKKHIVTTALAVGLTTPAFASPFYIDSGTSLIGLIDQLEIAYKSSSFLTDTDLSGSLNAGDSVLSTGGYLMKASDGVTNFYGDKLAAIGDSNGVTAFDPSFVFANDDYGSDWYITFGFDNLLGTYDGSFFKYTSGTVYFEIYDADSDTFSDALTVEISGTNNDIANTVFDGDVTSATGVFLTEFGETFEDYLSLGAKIDFDLNQNTRGAQSGSDLEQLISAAFAVGPEFYLTGGDHAGQITFNVPEPTSIALVGLGLLGLAGSRRKQAK